MSNRLLLGVIVVLGLAAGYWSGRSASETAATPGSVATPARTGRVVESPPRPPRGGQRDRVRRIGDPLAEENGAIQGQRSLVFRDRAAMERFLAKLDGTGVLVLDRIDGLHALRIAFPDADTLAGLLEGDEELGFLFPVSLPGPPGEGSIQEGAVAFGRQLIEWLGLPADRSGWGAGVTVAVIDSGVASHSAFKNPIVETSFLPEGTPEDKGHGTAVAALIAGEIGLAPDAEILSYQVADASGRTDTFTLVAAIQAAVDAGADVINISMGQSSPSALITSAVQYASDRGVVIFASSGNHGSSQVTSPAAEPGVLSIGSIDARGDHVDFSNSGKVDFVAPGLGLYTAWPDEKAINATGTSFSAPVATGSAVLLMSERNLTAGQAAARLSQHANERGAPGTDAYHGGGQVDPAGALFADQRGRHDVAVASNHLTQTDHGWVLQTIVENRGTEPVVNAPLNVTTPSGTRQLNVATLTPGATQVFNLPLPMSTYPQDTEVRIESQVALSGRDSDLNPANNQRVDVLRPADSP